MWKNCQLPLRNTKFSSTRITKWWTLLWVCLYKWKERKNKTNMQSRLLINCQITIFCGTNLKWPHDPLRTVEYKYYRCIFELMTSSLGLIKEIQNFQGPRILQNTFQNGYPMNGFSAICHNNTHSNIQTGKCKKKVSPHKFLELRGVIKLFKLNTRLFSYY